MEKNLTQTTPAGRYTDSTRGYGQIRVYTLPQWVVTFQEAAPVRELWEHGRLYPAAPLPFGYT